MMTRKIRKAGAATLTVAIAIACLNLSIGLTQAASNKDTYGSPLGLNFPATMRANVSATGKQGHYGNDGNVTISGDGRYVAFGSFDSNMVPGDTNGVGDVFVHDLRTGKTERVSVGPNGEQANNRNWQSHAISANGRYVVFQSYATNLVPGGSGRGLHLFVRDRAAGKTEMADVSSAGLESNAWPESPAISGDGRYVAFESDASNLVPADNNRGPDVFVHDRQSGVTERVSVSSKGAQANDNSFEPSISADGRYVAFKSWATNLVPGYISEVGGIFVRDRLTGKTELVDLRSTEKGLEDYDVIDGPAISADGNRVAFELGSGGCGCTIVVHDRLTGKTERASVSTQGEPANRSSQNPAISGDGRYVSFVTYATNLVPGDTNDSCDAFMHDLKTGETTRVSVGANGQQANENCEPYSALSYDGSYVAFGSFASNLVPGDTNKMGDVFVHLNR